MKRWTEVWTLVIPQQMIATSIPIFHWVGKKMDMRVVQGKGWFQLRRGAKEESTFLQLWLLERNLATVIASACSDYLWFKTLAYKWEKTNEITSQVWSLKTDSQEEFQSKSQLHFPPLDISSIVYSAMPPGRLSSMRRQHLASYRMKQESSNQWNLWVL